MTKLKATVLLLVFALALPLLAVPLLSQAANTIDGCGDITGIDPGYFYPASSTNSKEVVTRDGCLANIINRSSKNLFVPNKELTEWNAFKANAPQYVTVSVCGDGVCGESESIENCQADCYSPAATSYCGDRILTSGCGVCGYNGIGNMCPNFCNGGSMDLINCVWSGGNQYNSGISRNNEGIKQYFAISEALALETFF